MKKLKIAGAASGLSICLLAANLQGTFGLEANPTDSAPVTTQTSAQETEGAAADTAGGEASGESTAATGTPAGTEGGNGTETTPAGTDPAVVPPSDGTTEPTAPEETTPPAEVPPAEAPPAEAPAPFEYTAPVTHYVSSGYIPSSTFLDQRDKVKYSVNVGIDGLPSFITQEMVIGALKCQDETGYPASVTIAQIIQESGFGSYGPNGEEGKGLSYLAYQYCNLFGIKGTGTAGSVNMSTGEMTSSGQTYTTTAGFRAYNTYTECLQDRSKLLTEVYSDLIAGASDANTFAMQIGSRWATDLQYGKSLIKQMQTYDLYRLDDLTLNTYRDMIGIFANPCPGGVVTSTFGFRTFDNSFHQGLDLGTGSANIPTYAAEAGTVITAGWSNSAGNWIVIDHGNGLVTKYMHHDKIYVSVGDHVEKGQQIGLSGTTGNSTGNHLHFQVEVNGVSVDPAAYLAL